MPVGRTNRRAFIAALGGAAVAWPRLANAQDAASPIVGFLTGITYKRPQLQPYWAAFREGLGSLGYIEDPQPPVFGRINWAQSFFETVPFYLNVWSVEIMGMKDEASLC
jgi:hypothetical protein